jgi:two-component system, chemotaxis family, sensor kinase CheA
VTDSPDERGAELRELFFETSQELLQSLNEETLKLEKHPGDEEIVRTIRRVVHTLKGDAAACGLRELSELAHQFEDALTMENTAAHTELSEIAFASADVFSEMIAAYQGGGRMPKTEALRQRITQLTASPVAKKTRGRKKAAKSSLPARKDWTSAEKRAIAQAQAAGLGIYEVAVKIDPHCAMPIAARQLIQNAVSSMSQVLVMRPDAKSPVAVKQVEFVLASSHAEEQ